MSWLEVMLMNPSESPLQKYFWLGNNEEYDLLLVILSFFHIWLLHAMTESLLIRISCEVHGIFQNFLSPTTWGFPFDTVATSGKLLRPIKKQRHQLLNPQSMFHENSEFLIFFTESCQYFMINGALFILYHHLGTII